MEQQQEQEKKQESTVKIKQGRSPAYPTLSLEKAIERAEQVNEKGGARTAMPPETFYSIWGYGPKSSGARQTMAALNQFGLVDYIGRGNSRKVELTDLARRIVLDKVPNSKERAAAIRQAALEPEIYRTLLERFGHILPDNVVIQSYLERDEGYNSSAAKSLVSEYRDTFSYAELDKPDNITNDNKDDSPGEQDGSGDNPPEIAVGDYIQWESNGELKFEKALEVRAIQEHDGAEWVFVKGSETGILMNEAILESKGVGSASAKPPPTLPEENDLTPPSGTTKEVWSLDEGEAVLILPKELKKESFHDLDFWFQGIRRKAARKAGIKLDKDGKVIDENAGN